MTTNRYAGWSWHQLGMELLANERDGFTRRPVSLFTVLVLIHGFMYVRVHTLLLPCGKSRRIGRHNTRRISRRGIIQGGCHEEARVCGASLLGKVFILSSHSKSRDGERSEMEKPNSNLPLLYYFFSSHLRSHQFISCINEVFSFFSIIFHSMYLFQSIARS